MWIDVTFEYFCPLPVSYRVWSAPHAEQPGATHGVKIARSGLSESEYVMKP